MALTQLDAVSALVTIDLQKGIVGMPVVHPAADVVGRAAQLARAFRTRGLPVALVNTDNRPPGRTQAQFQFSPPPDWTQLVPELDHQAGDITVTKRSFGAFGTTEIDRLLRGKGVTQIILAGIATSLGVESTARAAYDLGYNVVFVSDAMTDRDAESHRNSVEKIFPRLGEIATTEEILARLTS